LAYAGHLWIVLHVIGGLQLWQTVADAFGCQRVAQRSAAVAADAFRSPRVSLLLGSDAWVVHTDNGIR